MSDDDFVTRTEHADAIRRLDQADAELRTSISMTERALRGEFEGKLADAVVGMSSDIVRVEEKVDLVQDHLYEQDQSWIAVAHNRHLASRVAWRGGIVTFLVVLTATLVTRYVFGVGG